MVDAHTGLGLKVISVIHTFIAHRGKELEPATWNHCIRLLLGGADSIFEGPVVSESNLGSNVGVEYIRLVFEVYLRSLPTVGLDLELWNLLDKFMLRWTHRLSLVKQWNAICMCLTAQIIRFYSRRTDPQSDYQSSPLLLQPPLLPTDSSVSLKVLFPSQWKYIYLLPPHIPSHVDLSPRQFKFGWHRLLHCLRNPNTVLHNKDSPIFLQKVATRPQFVLSEAIFGIATLSDEILTNMYPAEDSSLYYSIRNRGLLTTGLGKDTVDTTHLRTSYQRFRESNPSIVPSFSTLPHIVSANTILSLFGGWLFEAALRTQATDDFDGEEARAIALGALGRLFTSKFLSCYQSRERRLLSPHRDRYLLAMRYALDISRIFFSKKILATVLLSSHRVMGAQIEGVEILCAPCLRAIEEVLVSSRGETPSNQQKGPGARSRFRLQSSQPATGAEGQWENQMETSVIISQTATCGPDGFSSSSPSKNTETFNRPSEDDQFRDGSSKKPFLHYGDVPLVELRRACILLTSSVCTRMSCQRSPADGGGSAPSGGCGVSTLLKLLKSESDSTNLQLLVCSISALPLLSPAWSDLDQKARIEMITTTLLLLQSSVISSDVKAAILRMLGDLPSLHEPAASLLHPIELAVTILNGLCGFISSLTSDLSIPNAQTAAASAPPAIGMASPRSLRSPAKPPPLPSSRLTSPRGSGSGNDKSLTPLQRRRIFLLIDAAYLAIFEWISRVLDFQLVTNRSGQAVLNKIQEASVAFLHSYAAYFPTESSANLLEKGFCSNAFRIIDYLLSRAGLYPVKPLGSASNECHVFDQDQALAFEEAHQFCHFLIDNEVILSIGEVNRMQNSNSSSSLSRNTALLVITRSQFGKYIHELSSLSALETHPLLSLSLSESISRQESSASPSEQRPGPFTAPNDGLLSALRVARKKGDLLMTADPHHDWLLNNGSHLCPLLSFQAVQKGLSSPLELTSPWYNPFVARLRQQEALESSLRSSREPVTTLSVSVPGSSESETNSSSSVNLFIKCRHFLSHNRFLSSSCHGQVLQIANDRNFIEKLHALDDCPTRDQLEVWVAYGKNVKRTSPSPSSSAAEASEPRELIEIATSSSEEYNPNYLRFLRGLGWLVDLSTHTGFNADIDPSRYSGQLLYYASPIEEIVFHQHAWQLDPKSPEFSPAVPSRDRILASHSQQNSTLGLAPSVLILWNQCSQQLYPNSCLWEAYGLAPVEELILMIDPLLESDGDGLYRVRTFTPENSFYATVSEQADRIFGPLVDGMVVSLSHLAILVRRLVINAHRDRTDYRYHFDQPPHQPGHHAASPIPPLVARQRIINHVRNENAREQSLVSLSASLLFDT